MGAVVFVRVDDYGETNTMNYELASTPNIAMCVFNGALGYPFLCENSAILVC